MIYVLLGTMLLAALLVIALPLYRQERRLSLNSGAAIIVVLLLSVSMYRVIGSPGVATPAPGDVPNIDAMVASLAARLKDNPEDLRGWTLLARSHIQMRNFPAAIDAYERAIEIEGGQNGQTLADLGEVLLLQDGRSLNGRAADLFENALAVSPNNQKALFYSGMAAIQRGDKELGIERWENLLATSPPQNIQDILREQIAEIRGVVPAAPAAVSGDVVTVRVSLGESAVGVVQPDSTVFIIARDPARPSPPVAAVRRLASELPLDVALSDADAMIPGRVPSQFAELEILARVSMSGEPMARPGDWFGQQTVSTSESNEVAVIIDEQVP